METKLKYIVIALILGMILPWFMMMRFEKRILSDATTITTTQAFTDEISVQLPDFTIAIMNLEEYILGVLLGEMPAEFELEALKAQAVAARTFAKRSMLLKQKHEDFDICTNADCCQSYSSPDKYTKEHLAKFFEAVQATSNEYLWYNGYLAETTYFSCSGGRTEDAVAVWGTSVPYLKSVSSPGEENAVHYVSTVSFSSKEFKYRLGQEIPGQPGTWIKDISYTSGGGVKKIVIGNTAYSGTEIRQLLGLKSTAFAISVAGESITITTKGFGHRVGMSQYGADAMAANGKTYDQILAYYYPGTVLKHGCDI